MVIANAQVQAAAVTLSWNANPEPDIAGYVLYYGSQSTRYDTKINAGNVTSRGVSNLTAGATYYFALTAYNTAAIESDFSAELVYTVPASPPSNFPPTLNPLSNVVIQEDAGVQTITLSGISAGRTNESQALAVSATSSNPSLIPAVTVGYTSPNSSGALQFQPVANASGSSVITVRVDDGQPTNNTVARSFTVTVNPVNDSPRFDPIADVVLPQDAEPGAIMITGINSGAVNEPQPLTLTAVSSRPDILPNPAIFYTSPGASASLVLAPTAGTNGSSTVTVTLSDGQSQNGSLTRTFLVTVQQGDEPPVISAILDQNIAKNRTSAAIPFTISDAETDPSQLQVKVESSSPTVIPLSSITLAGAGANRSLTIDPPKGREGQAVLTISVSDPTSTSSTSFNVSVGNAGL